MQYKGPSLRQWIAILLALSFLPSSIAQEQEDLLPATDFGGANCSFKVAPDEFTAREARVRDAVFERSVSFKGGRAAVTDRTVDPSSIPIRGFIDEAIFSKLTAAGVASAPLSSDEEFLRRIYLDLTGRIPTIEQYRAFVSDTSERKRQDLIDRLLYSREFTDKWTMWWGDLLQNARTNAFRGQQVGARNNFYGWIAASVSQNKSIRDIVFELLTSKGNTEAGGNQGPTTWLNRWRTPGGPIEDTYDTLFSRSASAFMGMSHYDCLLCHDGRGHLDQLSLWGRRATRLEAYQMSAYFSRVRFTDRGAMDPEYPNSTQIADATTGNYNMNTTYGNRPRRIQIGSLRAANPVWKMNDTESSTGDWRGMYANRIISDRMFARNFANRL